MRKTFKLSLAGCVVAFALIHSALGASSAKPAAPPPAPATARDFYNLGAQRLGAGKLVEAEIAFQNALRRQQEMVQPPALYNLGHARFARGRERLQQSAPAAPVRAAGERARLAGEEAIESAEAALATQDLQQMIAAYQRGRGARKELQAAYEAVYRALELHRETMEQWRRALGDFRSAAELNPADTNALHNAQVVERALARLVDSVRQTQMVTLQCAGTRSQLDDLMRQLKSKIPADKLPACPAGESDEEDELGEPKLEELIGKKEAPGRESRELDMPLSPEEAGNLLDRFKPGGNRPLPMGRGEPGQPKDRKLRDW